MYLEAYPSNAPETPVTQKFGRVARELPKAIRGGNGSKFISKVMDKWAYENGDDSISRT
jgi:hypothetical protein